MATKNVSILETDPFMIELRRVVVLIFLLANDSFESIENCFHLPLSFDLYIVVREHAVVRQRGDKEGGTHTTARNRLASSLGCKRTSSFESFHNLSARSAS